MEYSENLILNPGAESGLTSWIASGVTIVTDGTKCFSVSPGGMLKQASGYVAFTLQPAEFVAKISFNYLSVVPKSIASIRAFYAISLKYLVESVEEEDTFVIPLDTAIQDATGWFTNTVSCATRSNAVLVGYDVMIYSDTTSPIIRIDNISLVSALDGLAMHELNENPHQLPLAITVGPFGIKATKGEQIMFWLKDTGDAVYAGEISAAQITIGQLTNEQIDVSGLDLLSNTAFSAVASNVEELDGIVIGQSTAIQNNADAILLQAIDIGKLDTAQAALVVRAGNIEGSVSTLSTQVVNNYNDLTGDISSVATTVTNNYAAINLRADGIVTNVSTLSTIVGDMDTIVDSHSSSITQLANSISSKVTNNITGAEAIITLLNDYAGSGIILSADRIDMTGQTTIYSPINASTYARIGGNYADFEIRSTGNPFFKIYDTIGGIELSLMGSIVLSQHSAVGITNVKGNWDFSTATVTGLISTGTMKWA